MKKTDALPESLKEPRLIISKSHKTLELYDQQTLIKAYAVSTGLNDGDKEIEGDKKTPEGDFYVCYRNPDSAFFLSLGLSYPNREDAERGKKEQLITDAEYQEIITAIDEGKTPPWYTALGGEIFIHGDGHKKDWTLGCIALHNPDMEELFQRIPEGTPVRINP